MNSFIETLNQWGANFLNFAWPMLWQSSLLIVILFAVDILFRRKIRASIRYALWLVVLVKLCLPPTLALPTSPAWWLPHATSKTEVARFKVAYDTQSLMEIHQSPVPFWGPPKPAITNTAWVLVLSVMTSAALLVWLLARWWHIAWQMRRSKYSERLAAIAKETRTLARMKSTVPVKLTANSMSPAVCGLFRPVILIPQPLLEGFSNEQLRAVLLHEMVHLRRRDVWLNFLQALLQIFYWWHPLLWLANARIRRVREEAVDDAVMLALRDEAETYAPTLLEVAKLALNRPLASLGLVGILESRTALRQRIERLVDFRPPRNAGLTLASAFGILAFTAVAVPMGPAPSPTEPQNIARTKNANGLQQIHIKSRFIAVPEKMTGTLETIPGFTNGVTSVLASADAQTLLKTLESIHGAETLAEPEVITLSGRQVQMRVTQIITVITNFALQVNGTNLAIYPQTSQVEVGPILDVVPKVLSDGHTIDLKTTASLTEFLGYDQPQTNAVGKYIKEYDVTLPVILPSFHIQHASAQLELSDGQTVVPEKLAGYYLVNGKEAIAEPGYFLGSRSNNSSADYRNKEVLVLITVTLVDPAGNRIHPDN